MMRGLTCRMVMKELCSQKEEALTTSTMEQSRQTARKVSKRNRNLDLTVKHLLYTKQLLLSIHNPVTQSSILIQIM